MDEYLTEIIDILNDVITEKSKYSIDSYVFVIDSIMSLNGIEVANPHTTGIEEEMYSVMWRRYGLLSRILLGKWGIENGKNTYEIAKDLVFYGLIPKTRVFKYKDFKGFEPDLLLNYDLCEEKYNIL